MDREYVEINPALRIKRLKTGEYRRWPDGTVQYALDHFRDTLRRAVLVALYTGQREGDIIRMTWADYDGTGIQVRQEKTGELLWIPCHQTLKAELDAMPRESTHIVTNRDGKPWQRDSFAVAMSVEIRKHDELRGLVFHGLRKTAAAMLAEAGVPAHHIMAVTGHRSIGMLAHYTKEAAQRKMATDAIAKWEKNGTTGEHSQKVVKFPSGK